MTLGLSIKEVYKIWNPNSTNPVSALHNINLDVSLGEFVVLLGPSGCGKSSLLYILAGLEQTSAGIAEFDGLPISKPSPERGLIFQEASLYPWLTVKDNITFGLKIKGLSSSRREIAAERLLKLVGLMGAGDHRPNQLSGGMRQRDHARAVAAGRGGGAATERGHRRSRSGVSFRPAQRPGGSGPSASGAGRDLQRCNRRIGP